MSQIIAVPRACATIAWSEIAGPRVRQPVLDRQGRIQFETREGGGSHEGGAIALRTDVDGSAAKLTYVITVGDLAAAAGQLVKQ